MKNFLYNKSDILVATAIIVVALLIIWSRVDVIMDTDNYKPSTKSTTTSEEKGTDENVSASDTPADPDTPTEQATEPMTEAPSTETTTPASTQSTAFVVTAGSSSGKVAEDLKAQGFISTTQEFIDMLKAKQVETKVKAGNFTIPVGATVEQIVEILTK
jgi:cytoskeletal protein RodZ